MPTAGEQGDKPNHNTPPALPSAALAEPRTKFGSRKRWLLLSVLGVIVAVVLVSVLWSRLSDTPERRLETLASWRTAPPRLVFEAVQYFQTHRDARAVPKLLEIMEGREYLKGPAAAALAFSADSSAVPILCKEIERHTGTGDYSEAMVQGLFAEALERIGDKAAVDPLINLIDSATRATKGTDLDKRVIQAAVSFRDQRVVKPLLTFIREYKGTDLGDDLKKIALAGIGGFGEEHFNDALETMNYAMEHDKYHFVHSYYSLAFSQMGQVAERQAVEWLHKSHYEKLGFATIVRTKKPELLGELRGFLMRASVADGDDEALAESYNEPLADMLISALSLKSKAGLDSYRSLDDVHKTAAQWLGAVGKPAIPKLKAQLSNTDNDVRMFASMSLAAMTELVDDPTARFHSSRQPIREVQLVLDDPNVSKDIYVVAGGHEYYLWYLKKAAANQDRATNIKNLLVDALEDNIGGRDLANDALKSSEPALSEAVQKWAKRNGFTIRTCYGPTSFGCF